MKRAAATVAVLVALSGCGGSDQGGNREAAPAADAYRHACDALARARAGDVAGARHLFHDEVHDPLHRLVDRLSDEDRAAAGRLLRAKQAVEKAVKHRTDLAGPLDGVAAALRAGIAATGAAQPAPCPED